MGRHPRLGSPEAVLQEPLSGPGFRQERSRRSHQALIDAASDLFSQNGYDAVGTPEIAQKAGVAVGTFYRYFDDKHAVYLEVMRRTIVGVYQETIANLTPETFAGASRHETLSRAVDVLFDHVMRHPSITRSFMEMSLRDPEVGALRRAFEQLACMKMAQLIELLTPRDVVPDPEAFAYVLYAAGMQVAYGMAVHLVPSEIERERARAALTAFIERTLFPER
jgi:AcrR family transcriptional regulator